MRASLIFSINDFIAHLGAKMSAFLLWLLGNRFPDLIVGAIIFSMIARDEIKFYKRLNKKKGPHSHY